MPSLHHPGLLPCAVVLVRTHYAGNLGSVARVMRNLGFSELVLVDPQVEPGDREARRQSTHGEEILHSARIVPDLAAALADCLAAAATSARSGVLLRSHARPPAVVGELLVPMLGHGKVALVFGPEPSGLTNEEITLCQHLIHIPAHESYPALNLAQSAAICLYELRQAYLAATETAVMDEPLADGALQQRMFATLQTAFEEIHYLYGPKGPVLMHGLRQLIGRARPTVAEAKLLLGLARQIRWFVRQAGDVKPLDTGESNPVS